MVKKLMSIPTKFDMANLLPMFLGTLEVKLGSKVKVIVKSDSLKEKSEVVIIVCLQLRIKTVNIFTFITCSWYTYVVSILRQGSDTQEAQYLFRIYKG